VPLSGTDADWKNREWRETRSIPISFLEELGQEDFWRCFVGRWGAEALKVYPWTEGRLVKRSGHALQTTIQPAPKQSQAWLEAAQQVDYKNLGPMTPDEVIAVRIANRRISREKEINKLVKTRRRLEKQKIQEQSKETLLPEVSQEDDSPEETPQEDNPAVGLIYKPGEQTPWQMRAENIEVQKDLLNHQIYLCAEEDERVQKFLKRKDVGTPEYLKNQKKLMDTNMNECKSFRKLCQNALDDDILSGYEQVLEKYEDMKSLLGRVSRQSSEDREFERTKKAIGGECVALLRRARACRDRGEHKKCCGYCAEILAKDDVAHYLRAGAFLFRGLSTTDGELKVWYLSEAVRVYKLMEHFEGDNPNDNTRTMKEHAGERLQKAKAELDAANAAAIKASRPGPKIFSTILPEKIPPKTPPNPKATKPLEVDINKRTSKPFTGLSNPPSTPPTPPISLDPAPKGMSPIDVIRHRRTFKVINQARRNFFNGDYDLAERGYLELLKFEGTSPWQKARCNVFLASIQTRNDRAERARTALDMYRGFLKEFPEDQRRIVAVGEAEKLLQRVLEEPEWDKGAVGNNETGNGHTGLGNGHTGLSNEHTGLETISEGENCSKDEGESEKKKEKKEEEEIGLVAGVVGKVASFWGIKRRREEDDDGENERGSRGNRKVCFAN
jgi:Fe-S-cluster containining protein